MTGKALMLHPTKGPMATATDVEMSPDPFAGSSLRALPRAFLRAYIERESLSAAAKAVGVSIIRHYHWLTRKEPGYAEAFEEAEWVVQQADEDRFRAKTWDGVTSRFFGPKGQLKMAIQKEDPALIKSFMASSNPEKHGRKEGSVQQVQVNVVFKDE